MNIWESAKRIARAPSGVVGIFFILILGVWGLSQFVSNVAGLWQQIKFLSYTPYWPAACAALAIACFVIAARNSCRDENKKRDAQKEIIEYFHSQINNMIDKSNLERKYISGIILILHQLPKIRLSKNRLAATFEQARSIIYGDSTENLDKIHKLRSCWEDERNEIEKLLITIGYSVKLPDKPDLETKVRGFDELPPDVYEDWHAICLNHARGINILDNEIEKIERTVLSVLSSRSA